MTSQRAFTLVEMLLVVTIIALLIATTLPVLGRSKPAARLAVCLSNLGQLSRAADQFTLDQQGRCFEYRAAVTGAASGTRWWFGFEPANSLSTQRPIEHEGGPLGPYLAGIGVYLRCGEFPYHDANHVAKFSKPAASYGYNWRLSGMRKLGSSELPDEAVRPQTRGRYRGRMSGVFIFADSVFFEPNPNPLAFFEGYYIAWQGNTASLSGYGHFRHAGQANAAYLDGHAEPQPLRGGIHKVVSGAPAGNLSAEAYGD